MTAKLAEKRNYLVVKDNDLIQKVRFNLTANQQKIIAYVVSMIKPGDTDFKKYEISVSDFCELCGISKEGFYSDFKNIIDDLDAKSFWIKTEEKVFKFRWFLKAEYYYKQGKVAVVLDDDIKKYLLDLQKNYTSYELHNILALKSKYSIRLYELFKSYGFCKSKEFEIEDFKDLLGCSAYAYRDFNRSILQKAVDEINFYTDIEVEYETITKCKKGVGIRFIIREKKGIASYESYRAAINALNK